MVEWFSKKAGSSVAEGIEDPTMVLIDEGLPDWVRLPPELGGTRTQVLRGRTAFCPLCQEECIVQHMDLEGDISVAECPDHGFVWYRTPKETKERVS